jgi:hypothetical protein
MTDPVVDLHAELIASLLPVTRAKRQRIVARGISCSLVGMAAVRPESDRLYEPDPDGRVHAIFPVFGRAHVCRRGHGVPRDLAGAAVPLVDLCAWRPEDPAAILLRRGAVAALGEERLEPFLVGDEPLRLFADPCAWARAGFDGCVILDWAACGPRLLLQREIVCDTTALGEQVNQHLSALRRRLVPPMPRINIDLWGEPWRATSESSA